MAIMHIGRICKAVLYHVVSHVNLRGSFGGDQIGCHEHCTLVIHADCNGSKQLLKLSHEKIQGKSVLASIRRNTVFSLSGRGSNNRLFVSVPTNKKMLFVYSTLPQCGFFSVSRSQPQSECASTFVCRQRRDMTNP